MHADETAVWQTDWNTAFKVAKEEHRLVFVDYFAFGCVGCRTMEDTVISRPDVQQRLNDFVLLREDFNQYNAPHAMAFYPTYVVYDHDQRERFRMMGSPQIRNGRMTTSGAYNCRDAVPADWFTGWLDIVRGAAPSFVRAAEMLDSGNELEANFLLGNAYAHVGEPAHARVMYETARGLAEKRGDRAVEQIAEAESALTFAHERNSRRAIKLLQKLAANPANRDTEAFIWLALGRAYEIAKEPDAARSAYQRTQSLAAPGSAAYKEANAAIEKLH